MSPERDFYKKVNKHILDNEEYFSKLGNIDLIYREALRVMIMENIDSVPAECMDQYLSLEKHTNVDVNFIQKLKQLERYKDYVRIKDEQDKQAEMFVSDLTEKMKKEDPLKTTAIMLDLLEKMDVDPSLLLQLKEMTDKLLPGNKKCML